MTASRTTTASRIGYVSRLRVSVGAMTLLTLVRLRAEAAEPGSSTPSARGDPQAADVFVTVREALLRDKPSKESRFVARLPGGSRLKLVGPGDNYLEVEVVAGTAPTADPPKELKSSRSSRGFLSREVAAIFPSGPTGTADLVAAGRALAGTETHRRLAAAFLLRASERLREEGPGDAGVELLLGETAETLAASGGPFPPGLEVSPTPLSVTSPSVPPPSSLSSVSSASSASSAGAPVRWTYTGPAFERALSLAALSDDADSVSRKERARAGVVRQKFPSTSTMTPSSSSLTSLWQETAAWLELVETGTDPAVLRSCSDRLGAGALALGRMLLAVGRLDDLEKLEKRVADAGTRLAGIPGQEAAGKKLVGRTSLLKTMRGTGTGSFPQEVRARIGPKEILLRIDGKLGALLLVEQTTVGGTKIGPVRKAAVPILPIPGSLRLSPDGRSAAWIEVVGPSRLVPVVAALERDEPARELAILSAGRPLRDQALAHVVSSLTGWSKDGQRLGVSIQAWNETPGPDPRYSVVSVATGELLFETSKNTKSFQRLIQ